MAQATGAGTAPQYTQQAATTGGYPATGNYPAIDKPVKTVT